MGLELALQIGGAAHSSAEHSGGMDGAAPPPY